MNTGLKIFTLLFFLGILLLGAYYFAKQVSADRQIQLRNERMKEVRDSLQIEVYKKQLKP